MGVRGAGGTRLAEERGDAQARAALFRDGEDVPKTRGGPGIDPSAHPIPATATGAELLPGASPRAHTRPQPRVPVSPLARRLLGPSPNPLP